MSFLKRRIDVSTDREAALLRRVGAFFSRLAHPLAAASAPLLAARERAPREAAYVVLDAGALLAYAGRDPFVRESVDTSIAEGASAIVPATVLLDPRVTPETCAGFTVVELDDVLAREAARLVAEARLDLPFDAVLVACAPVLRATTLFTADPVAARAFARVAGRPRLRIVPYAALSAAARYSAPKTRP